MTVCIAAVADDGKAVVMLSDKMLSVPIDEDEDGFLEVEIPSVTKIERVGETLWQALLARDLSQASDFVAQLGKKWEGSPNGSVSAGKARSEMEEIYSSLSKQILFDHHLRLQFASWEAYWATVPNIGESGWLSDLRKKLEERDGVDLGLLVCGFCADDKPHIFEPDDSGTVDHGDKSDAGYHAIGVGANIALACLARWNTDRSLPLKRVLYETYAAKVYAERMAGVGPEWDATVVFKDRCIVVPADLKGLLQRLCASQMRSPFDTSRRTGVGLPRNWSVQMDSLMRNAMLI